MTRLKRARKHRENEEPAINLTPLIDVVFSILIMFIVVAPLLELDQVILADSSSDSESQHIAVKEEGAITIHVHQNNTIWLNQKVVDIANLTTLLKLEKEHNPSQRPQIYHDKRAHFGTYQSVKNSVEAAGFEQMDVILKPI